MDISVSRQKYTCDTEISETATSRIWLGVVLHLLQGSSYFTAGYPGEYFFRWYKHIMTPVSSMLHMISPGRIVHQYYLLTPATYLVNIKYGI